MQSNIASSFTATNQIQSNDFGTYFVNTLLPYVKSFSYTWFHLQAAKRKHFKNTDGRMSIEEELKVKQTLANEESSIKIKWAMRLLMKLRKDIQKTCQKALIDIITAQNSTNILDKCVLSNPDMKGKMRRIDCLRQSDKVWRLDLVMVVLFKGIPLESSDGERLDKCASCKNPQLCINPNHSLLHVRDLEIYLSNFIPTSHLQSQSNESIVKMSQVSLSSVFTRNDFLELDKLHMRLEKNNENQIEFKEEDDNDELQTESGGDDCIDKQVNKTKKQKATNGIENMKKPKKSRTHGSPAKLPINMTHDENNVDFELNLDSVNGNSQQSQANTNGLKRKRTIKKRSDENQIVKNEQIDESNRQINDESTSCSSSQQDDEIKELMKLNANINIEVIMLIAIII
jgi:hypothetical protein